MKPPLRKVDVVDSSDDAEEPYRICSACHQRLLARALRPLEWFNLAKRHYWNRYLLHDDFYEEDGEATQPEIDVERPNDFLAPALAEVAYDPTRLLDYSITRWHFESDVASAWKSFNPQEVLLILSDRFGSTSNLGVRSRILEICASAVREVGANFVRYAWGEYPAKADLAALANASANCLPFREGFDGVVAALSGLQGATRRDAMSVLGYFHSSEALDWIEQNIFEPITESWGYLAAASKFDWPRAERWFEKGRPLSLVAIDALEAIARPISPFVRSYAPRLLSPPSPDHLKQVLSSYAARDRVPRVQQRTASLLSNIDALLRSA